MHVEVYSHRLIGVGIMPLRREHEQSGKLRIAEQSSDALKDVAVEDLEVFTRNLDLAADEAWTARGEVFIDNLV